jgi:hypothetical protein
MSDESARDARMGMLATGSTASLLAASGEGVWTVDIRRWETGSDTTSPEAIVASTGMDQFPLSEQQVWIYGPASDGGTAWFDAIATPGPAMDEMTLVGLMTLAIEQRRQEPRADMACEVYVRTDAGTDALLATRDLCGGGCRVEVPANAQLQVGDALDLDIRLPHGELVHAAAAIVRVGGDEAAVQFKDITPDARYDINRAVLGVRSAEALIQLSRETPRRADGPV